MKSYPNVRMRRRRQSPWLRDTLAETTLTAKDLILPIFVTESKEQELASLPGVKHYKINSLSTVAKNAWAIGIKSLLLFPIVKQKTNCASMAWAPDNLIAKAIAEIKTSVPEIGLIADVALDPYTSHGHDGLVNAAGEVMNDATVAALCKQALQLAAAGIDVLAPSDMMDGRVLSIRQALDQHGYEQVLILSYAAKYNSKLYAPFRGAIASSVKDKSSYQQDIRNADEAMHEIELDINEGADWIMIKPGITNLDVIWRARDKFKMPIAAYQVSGEYSMLAAYADNLRVDFLELQREFLLSLKRAGAMNIVCYNAIEVAGSL